MVLESTWITEVIGTQQGSTDWRYVRRNVPGQNVSFWSLQITQPQNESSNWDICMRISKNITKNKITIAKIRRLLWPDKKNIMVIRRMLFGVSRQKFYSLEFYNQRLKFSENFVHEWKPVDFTKEINFFISLSGSIIITVEPFQGFRIDADLWLAIYFLQSTSSLKSNWSIPTNRRMIWTSSPS